MQKLTRDDLYSLEQYAQMRAAFREKVMAHKKNRFVSIGPIATLYFEDRLTIQYQIQEMLRVERIFEAEGINDELLAYSPLIPDGNNWKATFMIEVPEENERRNVLGQLINVESHVWVRVGDETPVYAIADEDLERNTEEKTSSVHFMRFELTSNMVAAVKQGAPISMGIDHPGYMQTLESISPETHKALVADLD